MIIKLKNELFPDRNYYTREKGDVIDNNQPVGTTDHDARDGVNYDSFNPGYQMSLADKEDFRVKPISPRPSTTTDSRRYPQPSKRDSRFQQILDAEQRKLRKEGEVDRYGEPGHQPWVDPHYGEYVCSKSDRNRRRSSMAIIKLNEESIGDIHDPREFESRRPKRRALGQTFDDVRRTQGADDAFPEMGRQKRNSKDTDAAFRRSLGAANDDTFDESKSEIAEFEAKNARDKKRIAAIEKKLKTETRGEVLHDLHRDIKILKQRIETHEGVIAELKEKSRNESQGFDEGRDRQWIVSDRKKPRDPRRMITVVAPNKSEAASMGSGRLGLRESEVIVRLSEYQNESQGFDFESLPREFGADTYGDVFAESGWGMNFAFDCAEALYQYLSDYHSGQASEEYAALSSLGQPPIDFHPGMGGMETDGTAQEIYDAMESGDTPWQTVHEWLLTFSTDDKNYHNEGRMESLGVEDFHSKNISISSTDKGLEYSLGNMTDSGWFWNGTGGDKTFLLFLYRISASMATPEEKDGVAAVEGLESAYQQARQDPAEIKELIYGLTGDNRTWKFGGGLIEAIGEELEADADPLTPNVQIDDDALLEKLETNEDILEWIADHLPATARECMDKGWSEDFEVFLWDHLREIAEDPSVTTYSEGIMDKVGGFLKNKLFKNTRGGQKAHEIQKGNKNNAAEMRELVDAVDTLVKASNNGIGFGGDYKKLVALQKKYGMLKFRDAENGAVIYPTTKEALYNVDKTSLQSFFQEYATLFKIEEKYEEGVNVTGQKEFDERRKKKGVKPSPAPAATAPAPAAEKPAETPAAPEQPAETPAAEKPAETPAAPAAQVPATQTPAAPAAEKPAETPAAPKANPGVKDHVAKLFETLGLAPTSVNAVFADKDEEMTYGQSVHYTEDGIRYVREDAVYLEDITSDIIGFANTKPRAVDTRKLLDGVATRFEGFKTVADFNAYAAKLEFPGLKPAERKTLVGMLSSYVDNNIENKLDPKTVYTALTKISKYIKEKVG